MLKNGYFLRDFRLAKCSFAVVAVWFVFVSRADAQPDLRVMPVEPLGRSYGVAGPVANPFGPPPMAIGPVVGPLNYQPYTTVPMGYAPFDYSVNAYGMRRPSPFDVTNVAERSPVARQSGMSPEQYSVLKTDPQSAAIGNFRLTVSERFLNRIIARDEQRPGDVRDFILGARVTGHQITATKLRLDLLPSSEKIRGMLVLNGTVQSQTIGVTSQAMVDVASQQQFVALKELFFDGFKFSTRHAVVHVQARNQTLGATTPLTGTLFGGIANRIAYREAERRKPAAEAIARDRVADRVYPEFDSEIDKNLAKANDQLDSSIHPMLRTLNLMPSQQQVSSTDTTLSYSAQIASDASLLTRSSLDCQLSETEGACLQIHESLLNALVGRAKLKGLKTTDQQIRALFAPYEVKPTAEQLEGSPTPISIPGLTNVVTDIEFDEEEPLTIRIEQDRLLVTIRALFKPSGQKVIPALAVTIDYKAEIVGDKIVVTPGKAHVALSKSDSDDPMPSVALKMISQLIEKDLTKLSFDRSLPASAWPVSGPVPRIVGIRSQDGWAAITID